MQKVGILNQRIYDCYAVTRKYLQLTQSKYSRKGKADVQRISERLAQHFAQVRSTAGLNGQINEPPVIYFLGDC